MFRLKTIKFSLISSLHDIFGTFTYLREAATTRLVQFKKFILTISTRTYWTLLDKCWNLLKNILKVIQV